MSKKITGASLLSTIRRRFGSVEWAYLIAYGSYRLKEEKRELLERKNEPSSEDDVKSVFLEVKDCLGFKVKKWSDKKFPDAVLDLYGTQIVAEFEYKSSDFRKHGHDPSAVDLIICWEHDWEDSPVKVLELKRLISIASGLHQLGIKL